MTSGSTPRSIRIRNDVFDLVLQPGAGGCDRFRDGPGLPRLAVHEATDQILQRLVALRDRLADQKRDFFRQPGTPFHHTAEGRGDISDVDQRLPVGHIAGKDMAQHVPLVNALDLKGERRQVAIVRIDSGDAQQHRPDVAAPFVHHRLRNELGPGIRPFRLELPILVDGKPGRGRGMNEHGARIDDLLYVERG